MADVDFENFEGGYALAAQGRSARMVNLAGAACSVALVIGLGIWGYNLAVRDVAGVPVMRALGEPMRVAHANPGGDVASYQGLSVNAVAAAGTAAPLPDQLVLAPRPVELSFDDPAGLAMSPDGATPTPEAAILATDLPAASADVDQQAVALALADALADGEPLALVENAESGLDAAPRPMARPGARPEATVVPTDVQSVVAVAVTEIDPATLAVGTRLVQLGAFDDAAGARAEWARLGGAFGDLMAGKSLVIQAAQSGGRTFYRLRAHGFDGEDDARRFCSALLAENAACIPVAHR